MRSPLRCTIFLAICLARFAAPAWGFEFDAARSPLPPELHQRVVEVMNHYYNFEFDEAQAAAQSIADDMPDHPVGYFLLSETHWWQAVNDTDDPEHAARFQAASAKAIELCERRIDKDERDAMALFFLGGAYGRQAILAGIEGEHLKAVRAALDGRKHIQRLNRYHKDVEDAYLGLGLYDYYAADLPWFARVLGRLFLGLRGDKERGLAELERAAEFGLFTQVEARIFLAIIYLETEGRYADAIQILSELRERYPDNLNYYGLLGFAYRTQYDHVNSLHMLETLVAKADASEYYGRRSRSIAAYFLGSTYKFAGRFESALGPLDRVVADETDGRDNWLLVTALLERGRTHDLLGQRHLALRDYQRVSELKDFRNSQEKVRPLLERPYVAPEKEVANYLDPQTEITGDELRTGQGAGAGGRGLASERQAPSSERVDLDPANPGTEASAGPEGYTGHPD